MSDEETCEELRRRIFIQKHGGSSVEPSDDGDKDIFRHLLTYSEEYDSVEHVIDLKKILITKINKIKDTDKYIFDVLLNRKVNVTSYKGFIITPFDIIINDEQSLISLFTIFGLPKDIPSTELIDLIWILTWFKPLKSVDPVRIVKKIYSSSDRGLKKNFGTDHRIACVVQAVFGYEATSYLKYLAPKESSLRAKKLSNLYLAFKYIFNKEYQYSEDDLDTMMIISPSKKIRSSEKPYRNLLLNADDNIDRLSDLTGIDRRTVRDTVLQNDLYARCVLTDALMNSS